MENQPEDIRRTLLFLVRNNEILLALKKRGHGVGKWNGVGGKLEDGETVEQALLRETREEINVVPMNYRQVAELDFVQVSETGNPWHMYIYAYLCDEWQGDPSESEEMAPQWYTYDEIPYESMWQDDQIWLPMVLSGDKVTGMFTFDSEEKLISHNVTIQEFLPLEAEKTA